MAEKSESGKKDEVRRRNGPVRLSAELPALTRTAFRNTVGGRGFAEAGLLTDWPAVVGAEVARMSRPVQLAFPRGERKGGVLTIQCGGAAALELQHLKPQILDRINTHFGYGAVTEIRFRQGAASENIAKSGSRRRDSKPVTAEESAAVAAALAHMPEGEIKATLARLGVAVRRRFPPK